MKKSIDNVSIRYYNKGTKMTQEEVAKNLSISRAYYVRIEKGERQRNLDLSLVTKLAELFNVSVEWIAQQEQEKQR